jgi:hypothetical protein
LRLQTPNVERGGRSDVCAGTYDQFFPIAQNIREARPLAGASAIAPQEGIMIRKLKSGQYRLYSRKVDPKTGRRRNLGTFSTRAKAEKHERAVQFFKRNA